MRLIILALLLTLVSPAIAGYDIHLTRRTDWSNEKSGPPITLEEWKQFVTSDPEMRLDGVAETTIPDGRKLRAESAGLAVWIKWSKHGKEGMARFDWSDGEIVVKNPDTEIFGKMFRIAQKLHAKLQGDDGEVYDSRGEVVK